ncbi:Methionine aminopeptidase [Corynebacterium pseudotuberculosis]|nr:Methionine aminopeptidase [Corynebacterium pseudotuberculosis]AIG08667.1 Methionine aminopeptidase [Corynebacterium pseudotuberculosis]AIG10561.1 Methionine aminopeptidase [Corynebacterium pseudotuberculosis]VTQ69172.1 methionine aminopeptidase [Corynebacterium pseudotuberculosis]
MGFRSKRKVIPAKTPAELDAMQAAGEIVGKALQAVKAAAGPGVSTLELDAGRFDPVALSPRLRAMKAFLDQSAPQ